MQHESCDAAMSGLGQSRRFDCVPPTSALPLSTDIVRSARHVQLCQQRKSRLFDHFVANGRALLRWSFGQPGLPQSFFVSREIFGPPRAHHVFKSGNT